MLFCEEKEKKQKRNFKMISQLSHWSLIQIRDNRYWCILLEGTVAGETYSRVYSTKENSLRETVSH